jgi:hypothetical protein
MLGTGTFGFLITFLDISILDKRVDLGLDTLNKLFRRP